MHAAVIRPGKCWCMQLIVVGSPLHEQIRELVGSLLVTNNPLPVPGIVESLIFTPLLVELCIQYTGEPKHTLFLHRVPFAIVCVQWHHVSGHDQSVVREDSSVGAGLRAGMCDTIQKQNRHVSATYTLHSRWFPGTPSLPPSPPAPHLCIPGAPWKEPKHFLPPMHPILQARRYT